MATHRGLSPAMRDLLYDMREYEALGYHLRKRGGLWWTSGPTSKPARGHRMRTVEALVRRGVVVERYESIYGYSYHLAEPTP